MSEDFYEVLGVSRDASEDEIRRSFRKQAAEHHPDVSDDPNAEEQFKKIQKAKEVLMDEDKRAAYDQLGHDRFVQSEKHGGFDDRRQGGGPGGPFGGGDPFGGVGDIFEQFFSGGRGQRNGPRQGSDLKTGIEIELEDAYHGRTKQLTVTRPQECGECNGRGHPADADVQQCPECNGQGQVTRVQQAPFGRVQQTQPCPRCEGEGELVDETCRHCGGDGVSRDRSTLTVDIPAGIQEGQTLRMEGEGAPGRGGGPSGDLLIEVSIADHDTFERDGDDLHIRKPISFPQAVFGDTVTISTIDDEAELDIPDGIQSGETLTIKNEGMPRLRGRGQGDLIVHVQIVTPSKMSTEEREALEAFAEAGGEEIEVEQGLFERLRSSI